MAMEPASPRRLIDVKKSISERRVVYAPGGDLAPTTYSALSYVWAKTLPDFYHTHVGVEWKVSAFKQENMNEVLQIVRDCNVNFLWVDAYCIDQSDQEDKGRELPRMGSYYSNASSVFILPNGVDNIYEDSIVFGKWERHWCMWTQRVWTVPEFSLAKKALVIGCLTKEQGQRIRSITTADINKQLFPIKIDHHFPLKDNKEIIVTDVEGYCRAVELKASGYLDGKTDSHNIDYDDPSEVTQRTLLSLSGERNLNINRWIHLIVRRHCEEGVDRVHAMLPILNMNLAFVNTSNDLNGILATVFERADIHVLAQLMLATRTRGEHLQEQEETNQRNKSRTREESMTIYPALEFIELATGEGDILVHIDKEIHLDNGISKNFVKNKGLVLKDVIITKPVKVQRYEYEGEEDTNQDGNPGYEGGDILGNIPYELEDFQLPCCVGKCKTGVVELVRLGTTGISTADEWRMRGLELRLKLKWKLRRMEAEWRMLGMEAPWENVEWRVRGMDVEWRMRGMEAEWRMVGMEAPSEIKIKTLVCCLACTRHTNTSEYLPDSTCSEFLEKVGVLLVDEGTFNKIPSVKDKIILK